MRLLSVNHGDRGPGGAAVAGYRLHHALVRHGMEASLLVGRRTPDALDDETVGQLRQWNRARRPLKFAFRRLGLNELDGIAAYSLHRRVEFQRADVVHYHAIHGDYFSYPAMPRLSALKPSVLTLHDMWPLTGHCAFSFGCERWATGCGNCPHPDVFPAVRRDSTAIEWRLKDRVWRNSTLQVVSPSRWLADVAVRSMLGRFEVSVIPHGIDTEVFAPVPKEAARAALGIGPGPVVAFGSALVVDPRKGADLFVAALRRLVATTDLRPTITLMGHRGGKLADSISTTGCPVVDFGYVASERIQASVYSAADVFAFSSRADNSPLTILESLACGTPVVSFDVGGVAEMVRSGENGALVAPEKPEAMADAVAEVLADAELRRRMGQRARERVLEENREDTAVRRHIELYQRARSAAGRATH